MEVTGKIKTIKQVEKISDKFKKRELVIETHDKYPQPLLLEFVQDNTALLDNFSQDQDVKIGINLRGREWTSPQGETRYFNSIQGWKIESYDTKEVEVTVEDHLESRDNDDLPFKFVCLFLMKGHYF